MQTIQLGEMAIDIPSFLDWRVDDGTLVAYLPGTDFANLRFTLLSISESGGVPVPGAGVRFVTSRCAEANAKLEKSGETVWYCYTQAASDGTEGSLMHFWNVGLDAHVLIISCFVEAEMAQTEETDSVLSSVGPAIRSFRR